MVDFKKFKKSSEDIKRLSTAIEKLNKPTQPDFEEKKFWRPTPDKAGNSYAVIRFLPEPAIDGDDAMPYVRIFSHSFQNQKTQKWYIENSLRTIGEKDPVAEYNSAKWKAGDEDTARAQKRNTQYVVNIKVLENPNNKEEEGKVFPYKIGTRIFRKIEECIDPWHDAEGNEIPGTENLKSVDPFNFWTGATFRLRMKTVKSGNKKYPNYDDSTFVKDSEGQVLSTPLSTDEKELEKIWTSLESLNQYIAPDQFKTYEELRKKLYEVVGERDPEAPEAPRLNTVGVPKSLEETIVDDDDESPFVLDGDESDDESDYFKKLANKSI